MQNNLATTGGEPDLPGETFAEDPAKPIGAVPFRVACDRSGGPNRLPISPAQGYKEVNAGRIRTFKIGRLRYISLAAIAEYIAAREAEATDNGSSEE